MSRVEKVESLLKKSIAEIISRKVGDYRLGFVSITRVKVSKDLRTATVYYSQLGSAEEREKTYRGLVSASKYIQSQLHSKIRLRVLPILSFKFDDSIEKGSQVVNKINQLRKNL